MMQKQYISYILSCSHHADMCLVGTAHWLLERALMFLSVACTKSKFRKSKEVLSSKGMLKGTTGRSIRGGRGEVTMCVMSSSSCVCVKFSEGFV